MTDIKHRFGTTAAVHIDTWIAGEGEHWLLAGPSGSGKSTLLNILAGLLRPSQGSVVVGDQEIYALAAGERDRWRGRNVGYVPQRLHLVPSLSTRDNIVLAQYLAGCPVSSRTATELLEAVNVAALAERTPDQLSQGQAQRVAIARAVVNRPRLLLADEPTAALDDLQARAAIDLLVEHARGVGATLVVASHDARIRAAFDHVYPLQEAA
jgi:putative ABC transport system ATP-binding protein